MADSKISQLPLATDTSEVDYLLIARTGANYRLSLKTLFNKLPSFIGSTQIAQSISSSGAIDVTNELTQVTTTATQVNLSLPAGISGQEKTIVFVNKGTANVVITPVSGLGFTNVTLSAVGHNVRLKYIGTSWVVISSYGAIIA